MYFCYTDESGDCGAFNAQTPEKSGTPYFILTGLITSSKNWKSSLDWLKSFRKRIAADGFLNYDIEFHCSELVDPHKISAYNQISVAERWMLIAEFAQTIGQYGNFKIISIVIDKRKTNLKPEEYQTTALTKLYVAFDEFLKREQQNGLVYLDRTNEKQLARHARKLIGTGNPEDRSKNIQIRWIIEDPIFRNSSDSIFIQSADVIAYTLKEKEFPTGSRKKYNADRIFDRKLLSKCFRASEADEDGIIRA
jgi:Protein of unknown function (DUF3800)